MAAALATGVGQMNSEQTGWSPFAVVGGRLAAGVVGAVGRPGGMARERLD